MRRIPAVTCALAVMVTLTACDTKNPEAQPSPSVTNPGAPSPGPSDGTNPGTPSPEPTGSTPDPQPTGSAPDPDAFERYYTQTIEWGGCSDVYDTGDHECGYVLAPMDWSNPDSKEIRVLVSRAVPTGEGKEVLFVNPGGPGGAGVDMLAQGLWDWDMTDEMRSTYDFVSWNPRGVLGEITPAGLDGPSIVQCAATEEEADQAAQERRARLSSAADAIERSAKARNVGNDPEVLAEIDMVREYFAENAANCAKYTGELLEFVDTQSTARDLDMIRAVLGQKKTNLVGYSYGTDIAVVYANLFPENTGSLVLDGVLPPGKAMADRARDRTVATDRALRNYIAECQDSHEGCPFEGDADQGVDQIRELLDSLKAAPIPTDNATYPEVTFDLVMWEIVEAVPGGPWAWPIYTEIFAGLFAGDPAPLIQFLDPVFDNPEWPEWEDIEEGEIPDIEESPDPWNDANSAVTCLDVGEQFTTDEVVSIMNETIKSSPVYGKDIALGILLQCDAWAHPAKAQLDNYEAVGAPPILVIGNTGDPATSYEWSLEIADTLQSATHLTYEGNGHCIYMFGNECIDSIVNDFLVNKKVPDAGTTCTG